MRTVLVIGAGASGLTATAALAADGFRVTCVDTEPLLGGCWLHAFDFVTVQSSAQHYRVPGMRYRSGTPNQPGKEDVLDLWNRFAIDKDIVQYLRLGTSVTHLRREGSEWVAKLRRTVGAQDLEDPAEEECRFDFVVVATGVYGHRRLALEPDLPGKAEFPGNVCHAVKLPTDWVPPPGERVVIVGAGPTSLDYAEAAGAAAERDGDVHLVVREPRWAVPTTILGFLSHSSILFNRLNAAFITCWRHVCIFERILHSWPFVLFVHLFWMLIEQLVYWSVPWPDALRPPRGRLLHHLRNAVPVLPRTLFDLCRKGRVTAHVATIEKLDANGSVHLSSGVVLRDVRRVILATGYKLDGFEWMDETLRRRVVEDGGGQLYRHIVVPGVDRLAFVGFGAGFFTPVTEHVQAQWICALFDGSLKLPSEAEMRRESARVLGWKHQNVLREDAVPYATNCRFFHYIDELLSDIGVTTKRTSFIGYVIGTWGPEEYETIRSERIAAARGQIRSSCQQTALQ